MKLIVENVQIVYAATESGIAESIRDCLQYKLHGGQAPQNTAIVLVSDAATEDPEWKDQVRAIPESTRLVPAGQTINADYSNPEVIPPRVEELNFIRIDDDLMDNLWESVTIDAEFYAIRNNVLVNMDSWLTSQKSDAFLLASHREARKGLRVVRQRLQTETDERSRAQLSEMETYLEASRKKSLRKLLGTIRHRTVVVLLVAFLVWLVPTAANILGYMQRASDEMALLGTEKTEANAFENVVRLLDGVDNPLVDSSMRANFMQEVVDYLDLSWCTTPIGLNYKHKLTDAQLISDRYIQTATDHGHQLIWDTWNGTIDDDATISNVTGFKAFHTDVDNGIVVAVTSDNKVLFGIGDQWLTNDYEHPFVDGEKVFIVTDESHVLVHDSLHVYTYERTENGGIRPATFITPDTMPLETYAVHSAVLTPDSHVVAFEGPDDMYMRVYRADGESGYYMDIKPLSTCRAAVREGQLAFADEDGNLMLFDAESITCEPMGLKLPDPRVVCFVNDTTVAYFDGMLGCRLYDFDGGIDLGSAFSGFADIDELVSNGTTLMCHSEGLYICQPIDTMIPLRQIDESAIVARYDNKVDVSDNQIRSIAIYSDHTVQYEESRGGGDYITILDGGHYHDVGPAIGDKAAFPKEALRFKHEPILWDGEPTVVGLIDNGYGFVIGAEDGSFRETVVRTNGSLILQGSAKTPSHSAIKSIIEMEDCYYLLDEAGYYWRARLSYPAAENGSSLLLSQINAKLHHGVTQKLYDSVSQQTRDDIGLTVMPGGDGKEWD